MHNRIVVDFLESNKILTTNQNYFINQNQQSMNAMCQLLKVVLQSLNSKEMVPALLLDLGKAFDSVDISTL